jgi:Fe-Mn family superoxide dismutase
VPEGDFMTFTLPRLPYSKDALLPYMSVETLEYHHGKHHAGYVKKLNELVQDTPLVNESLEDIIKDPNTITFENGLDIQRNACQTWNHNFFWQCLAPAGQTKVTAKLSQAFEKHWGGVEKFKKDFSEKAEKIFGTGWCWLVQNAGGGLEILQLEDEENPLPEGKKPLLVLDVWEHAYYIDYRNDRKKFIDNFWHIANWDFVARNL